MTCVDGAIKWVPSLTSGSTGAILGWFPDVFSAKKSWALRPSRGKELAGRLGLVTIRHPWGILAGSENGLLSDTGGFHGISSHKPTILW